MKPPIEGPPWRSPLGGFVGASTSLEWVFEVSTHGRVHRELVALIVTEGLFENTIRVSEFVTEKARFEQYVDDVRRAVATVE